MDKKVVLSAIIVICLAALVYISLSGPEDRPPPLPQMPPGGGGMPQNRPGGGQTPGQNMAAPDFELPSLNGGTVKLSDFKGKIVVMNFWSSTCGPCLMEMPSFERLQQKMQGKPFKLITITSDPERMAQRTLEKLNLNIDVLVDQRGKVFMQYGVFATPETFIVAPDGTIDQKVMGAANWGDQSVIDYMEGVYKRHGAGEEPGSDEKEG